jgi:transposase
MYYFVGIDPAAESFTAAALKTPEHLVLRPASFDNTAEGSTAFEAWLAQAGLTPQNTRVSIENTGVYSEALCYDLHRRGFALALIDPYAVWRAFKQGPKTDPLDSGKIAEYAYRYRDQLRPWQPNALAVEQVRVLLSTREQLVEQKTATGNARQALTRKAVQTPAANQALEATIMHLKEQINAIEAEIRRLITEHPTTAQMFALLTSAPGVSLLLGAHLMVLTNGFAEVPSHRRLAQYLGIAPNEHESGTSVRRKARSRGYGAAAVRKLLHLAARSVRTHHAGYRHYFLRKVQEGKAAPLVLNNIANKLLKTLCAMMKNKQPYISTYQSINPTLLHS